MATLLSHYLDVTQCTIAHALEKTKYDDADVYWCVPPHLVCTGLIFQPRLAQHSEVAQACFGMMPCGRILVTSSSQANSIFFCLRISVVLCLP